MEERKRVNNSNGKVQKYGDIYLKKKTKKKISTQGCYEEVPVGPGVTSCLSCQTGKKYTGH